MGAEVFSVATLAEHWGCGTDTVYALIRGGSLRAFKLGGKLLRIRADEVERFECQTTPCNDTESNSLSSGQMRRDEATDIRLERLIEHQPRPQLVNSGNAGR